LEERRKKRRRKERRGAASRKNLHGISENKVKSEGQRKSCPASRGKKVAGGEREWGVRSTYLVTDQRDVHTKSTCELL
jgi:hypothetical protein